MSTELELRDLIRYLAGPLVLAGKPPSEVRQAVQSRLGIGIGTGGGGPDESVELCGYCGAYGGGGHGGLCPNGSSR